MPDFSYPISVPDPQDYAIKQERWRHESTLWAYGEVCVFAQMWSSDDFAAGLVEHCSRCYLAYGKTAEAYGQPAQEKCPDCLGTSFEGGYKNILVRPALWDLTEPDDRSGPRGDVDVEVASVQSTGDFRMHSGDYVLRADNSRWVIRQVGGNHLHTGMMMIEGSRTALGYNYAQVTLDDPSGVSSLIPVSAEILASLDVRNLRTPDDYSSLEDIRGPLY